MFSQSDVWVLVNTRELIPKQHQMHSEAKARFNRGLLSTAGGHPALVRFLKAWLEAQHQEKPRDLEPTNTKSKRWTQHRTP